jgi:hypothetical protein
MKKVLFVLLCLVILLSIGYFVVVEREYRYLFENGTVYITEDRFTPGFGLEPRRTCYWIDSTGEKSSAGGTRPTFNGLLVLPTLSSIVPPRQDPFKWKPERRLVEATLTNFFHNYDGISKRAGSLGIDVTLKKGESAELAFARLTEELAQRYCSYDERRQQLGKLH